MKLIERKCKFPSRYNIYWDASIPMEYYEEDFLQFEQMMIETGGMKVSDPDEPHASSTYVLEKFAKLESRRKVLERREWMQFLRAQKQK